MKTLLFLALLIPAQLTEIEPVCNETTCTFTVDQMKAVLRFQRMALHTLQEHEIQRLRETRCSSNINERL